MQPPRASATGNTAPATKPPGRATSRVREEMETVTGQTPTAETPSPPRPASTRTERSRGGVVRQFSIFAENKVGRLNDLLSLLAVKDVHVLAICLVDTTDSTIIRVVVDYPEVAAPLLKERGFAYNLSDVLAVEIDSEAQLKIVTCALVQAEINIHYIYPFVMRPGGKTGLVLQLEDPDLATDVLARNQVKVLTQSDLAR